MQQVVVDRRADAHHEGLPDEGHREGLEVAASGAQQSDGNVDRDNRRKQIRLALANHPVDDHAHDERRQDADGRQNARQPQHAEQLEPEGLGKSQYL